MSPKLDVLPPVWDFLSISIRDEFSSPFSLLRPCEKVRFFPDRRASLECPLSELPGGLQHPKPCFGFFPFLFQIFFFCFCFPLFFRPLSLRENSLRDTPDFSMQVSLFLDFLLFWRCCPLLPPTSRFRLPGSSFSPR